MWLGLDNVADVVVVGVDELGPGNYYQMVDVMLVALDCNRNLAKNDTISYSS